MVNSSGDFVKHKYKILTFYYCFFVKPAQNRMIGVWMFLLTLCKRNKKYKPIWGRTRKKTNERREFVPTKELYKGMDAMVSASKSYWKYEQLNELPSVGFCTFQVNEIIQQFIIQLNSFYKQFWNNTVSKSLQTVCFLIRSFIIQPLL